MKQNKTDLVEILGCIGIFIWVAVIFLREMMFWDNRVYLFLLGILPNLGAAWAATLFGKWLIQFKWKKKWNAKSYFALCVMIFILALLSEIVHDLFLQSPFDFYDILITAIAQAAIFVLPSVQGSNFSEVK